jgi:PIN domain nuclease of toxin-antitoxin system
VSGRPEYALDSTALIALVTLEPGYEKVEEILDRSAISAVNLAESVHKLVQRDPSEKIVETLLRGLKLEVIDWSEDFAYQLRVGSSWKTSRPVANIKQARSPSELEKSPQFRRTIWLFR